MALDLSELMRRRFSSIVCVFCPRPDIGTTCASGKSHPHRNLHGEACLTLYTRPLKPNPPPHPLLLTHPTRPGDTKLHGWGGPARVTAVPPPGPWRPHPPPPPPPPLSHWHEVSEAGACSYVTAPGGEEAGPWGTSPPVMP
jgi:hypothetical protein